MGADPRAPARPRLPIRGALGFYGVILGAAVLWRSVLLGEPLLFASEEAARAGLHPLRDLALGAACGLAAAAGSGLAERRTAWGRRLATELAGLVGPVSRAEAAVLALASGVAEEAFFRGALQPSVGLVAASVLFALVHVPASRGLRPWPVLALAAGLGLGLLFEATGSLVAPVAAHVLVNALGLASLSQLSRQAGRAATREGGEP